MVGNSIPKSVKCIHLATIRTGFGARVHGLPEYNKEIIIRNPKKGRLFRVKVGSSFIFPGVPF